MSRTGEFQPGSATSRPTLSWAPTYRTIPTSRRSSRPVSLRSFTCRDPFPRPARSPSSALQSGIRPRGPVSLLSAVREHGILAKLTRRRASWTIADNLRLRRAAHASGRMHRRRGTCEAPPTRCIASTVDLLSWCLVAVRCIKGRVRSLSRLSARAVRRWAASLDASRYGPTRCLRTVNAAACAALLTVGAADGRRCCLRCCCGHAVPVVVALGLVRDPPFAAAAWPSAREA